MKSVSGLEYTFGIFQRLDSVTVIRLIEITKDMSVGTEEAEIKG